MTEKSTSMPPFPKDNELVDLLSINDDSHGPQALCGGYTGYSSTSIPGYPLQDATDTKQVQEFLSSHLLTPRLDDLHPVLWMVGTRKSDHVYSLHKQIVRGHEIVYAEDPGLHLVWYYDKIYIKPIPPYLLNHAFWNTHLYGNSEPTVKLRQAALGFMRTYVWLIQSEYDFHLAQTKMLVPGNTTFLRFMHFIDSFRHIQDTEVNPRYRQYGQLRLSRLNLWSKLYQGRMFYYKVDAQYAAYFARFVPLFLFIFGSVSVALSGMSVVLAVDNGFEAKPDLVFARVSNWFSVACMVVIAAVLVFFPVMQVAFLLRELVYVVWNWNRKGFRD
ncbi:hypothetical protein BDV25DRAFT_135736 [Aspergillus avenaceus]|uniref:Subtilisin-like serine protease n=1 Tax=Aspergillus avenaceus TaxID=36643 RepID=A0A5N6U7I6_ASPAV|nr:hypothetical protein BDV25DRAFT_135736 [Aspergillus avenaceus]